MSRRTGMVSVIIPVYKCEKYIGACIESVLSQTYQKIELILVDDGSPDKAPVICDEYAQKDSRVKVIHKSNGGVSSARNAGIDQAEGAYITFIDSDDYIDADFLWTLVTVAENTQADIVASGLKMEIWGDEEITGIVEYSFLNTKLYDTKTLLEAWGDEFPPICMCGPWCKLYRKTVIDAHQIRFAKDLNCGEDTLFNLEFLEKCFSVFTMTDSFYHYRRGNEESLFSRFHKDIYEIHRRVYTKQWALMNARQCSEESLLHSKREYFTLMIGGIHEYYRFCEKTTREEKLDLIRKISEDPFINQTNISTLTGIKNKIFCFLLQRKLYGAILWLFERHYSNGRK